MHGCTHSDLTRPKKGFTILEIVVVAAILFLIVLALLPALRSGDGEQHFQLQPRPTLVMAAPTPEPTGATPPAEATPAPTPPAPPKALLR